LASPLKTLSQLEITFLTTKERGVVKKRTKTENQIKQNKKSVFRKVGFLIIDWILPNCLGSFQHAGVCNQA
jgi:hypothetical protein